jgi:hydrogenase maturation factor
MGRRREKKRIGVEREERKIREQRAREGQQICIQRRQGKKWWRRMIRAEKRKKEEKIRAEIRKKARKKARQEARKEARKEARQEARKEAVTQ